MRQANVTIHAQHADHAELESVVNYGTHKTFCRVMGLPIDVDHAKECTQIMMDKRTVRFSYNAEFVFAGKTLTACTGRYKDAECDLRWIHTFEESTGEIEIYVLQGDETAVGSIYLDYVRRMALVLPYDYTVRHAD